MRRIIFCLAIALLAFGIGFLIVPNFYQKPEKTAFDKTDAKIKEVQTEEKKTKIQGTGDGEGQRLNAPVYIPKLHKATCTDKNLLPVWNELRKDKEFKKREKEFYQEADCTKTIEIQKADLNGDGRKEFIVWGRNNFCGGTGNCIVWIYESKNGNYKQLLQDSAYYGESKWIEIKKDKTKGYKNLLLKGHFTGYETTHSYFRFNGVKYVEKKCLFEIYSNDEKSFMTCNEYSKKIEEELRDSQSKPDNQ